MKSLQVIMSCWNQVIMMSTVWQLCSSWCSYADNVSNDMSHLVTTRIWDLRVKFPHQYSSFLIPPLECFLECVRHHLLNLFVCSLTRNQERIKDEVKQEITLKVYLVMPSLLYNSAVVCYSQYDTKFILGIWN